MQISQNFIKENNMPLFSEILLSKFNYNTMANKILTTQKRAHLPYIKENFGRLSQREIARRLAIGKTTINRWSRELGLFHQKHAVNENFFDKLNEESSYFLGYLFADGNNSYDAKKGHYSITITASEKDKEHMEKLRELISSTKPLIYSTKTKSYRLIFNSKILCKKLIEYGMTPRKSLTLKFPKIPKNQLRHFIRGIIDGDGNVRYVNRKRSPYFEITIASGSKKFCEGIVKSIKESAGIDANIRKIGKNTYLIQYSCFRGEKLAKYIYSNANISLERKYLPYKNNIMGV